MKYKYIGTEEMIFPTLGLDLMPGQEFESDIPIVSPLIEEESTETTKKEMVNHVAK